MSRKFLVGIFLAVPICMFAQQTRVSSTPQRVPELKIDEWAIFEHDKNPVSIGVQLLNSIGSNASFDNIFFIVQSNNVVTLSGQIVAYSIGGKYILFENQAGNGQKGLYRFSKSDSFYSLIIDELIKVLRSDKNKNNTIHITEVFGIK